MQAQQNFSLKNYNTFGIDVRADRFVQFDSESEIVGWLGQNTLAPSDFLILGGGSNFLFTKQVNGLVLHPNLKGMQVVSETETTVHLQCAAGEVWDDVVAFAVERGWSGIENLSHIPGTIGAAPVQNIGAYGVEVESVFHSLEAYEIKTGAKKIFRHADCNFRYRNSFFKEAGHNAYLITAVTLELRKDEQVVLSYSALSHFFSNKPKPTLQAVRQAIIEIRKSKLPDPSVLGNAGSFFKNPVVSQQQVDALLLEYPELVFYPLPNGEVKLAAAWLIESMGWKGYREHDAGVHQKQALVLVNYGKATGDQLYQLAMQIRSSILKEYGVLLEPEVNLIR